jgi:hypothetical protein
MDDVPIAEWFSPPQRITENRRRGNLCAKANRSDIFRCADGDVEEENV